MTYGRIGTEIIEENNLRFCFYAVREAYNRKARSVTDNADLDLD